MGKKEKKDKKEKPLDKMTATELRKYALELGEITGVHGMNKEELLAAIKKVKGIVDEGKKAAKTVNMRELKQKIKELRSMKAQAYEAGEPNKKINILRRRMNRLKKRTRKAA
ncbi:MAG: Rho termination factor N-terminal domain-containing protein [Desulfobaccales bacterium]